MRVQETRRKRAKLRRAAAALPAALLLCALPAHAQQDRAETGSPSAALAPNTARALSLSSTLDGALDGTMVDLSGLDATRLDLDLSGATCLAGRNACGDPADLDYSRAFDAGGALGLDFELEPRASVRFSDSEDSALVGAIVRIGDDLREDGQPKRNTWYLFAGADAEAMTYRPGADGGGVRRLTSGELGLQDRVIVGDAQAGIGYRLGDADVSVGYYRREISSIDDNDPTNDFSRSQDAAAISFTWRR